MDQNLDLIKLFCLEHFSTRTIFKETQAK